MGKYTEKEFWRFAPSNYQYKHYSFDYFLKAQSSFGFQNIELYLCPPHVWIDWRHDGKPKVLRRNIETYGLSVPSVRAEFESRLYMIAASDPGCRNRTAAYLERCLNCACELGAQTLLINASGVYFDEPYEVAFIRLAESILILCEKAALCNLKISLESFCPHEAIITNSLDELVKLSNAVNHPALAITLDTVAISEAGETIPQWFHTFGEKIAYVRFSDGRKGGGRYIWGEGIYPLERYLTQLEENNYCGYFGLHLSLENYIMEPMQADIRNRNAIIRGLK